MRAFLIAFGCAAVVTIFLGALVLLGVGENKEPVMYRICNGKVEAVYDVAHAQCPDGSLRLVR